MTISWQKNLTVTTIKTTRQLNIQQSGNINIDCNLSGTNSLIAFMPLIDQPTVFLEPLHSVKEMNIPDLLQAYILETLTERFSEMSGDTPLH